MEETRSPVTALLISIFILTIITTISAFGLKTYNMQEDAKCTTETEGTIVAVLTETHGGGGNYYYRSSVYTTTKIKYKYTVNNVNYICVTETSIPYTEGETVQIKYNPENPQRAILVE